MTAPPPEAARDRARRLQERGDLRGALAAYLEAIESGDPQHAPAAARDLGQLLHSRRDLEGARAAYRLLGPANSAYAEGGMRLLRGRLNPALEQSDGLIANGPDIPAVFDLAPDPELDHALPAEAFFNSPIISRRVADVSVLIGSGELTAAESVLVGWCAEEESSRSRHSWVQWPFTALFRIYEARGDLSAAAAVLSRYRACDRFAADDVLVGLLEEGLAQAHAPAERRGPIFPWSGDHDVLSDALWNGDQFHDAGTFFRPLSRPAAGGARFVLVGGPMCYIDRRGEHSCITGDPVEGPEAVRLAEDTGRVFALTESPTWTAAVVGLGHRLLPPGRCSFPRQSQSREVAQVRCPRRGLSANGSALIATPISEVWAFRNRERSR
ncbi:tetratricopeptide repeat protein [Pseudonocardia sp. Cha107L01]|uniref:tetratricopeptide repeat protein n=1 Tax=Pseudonocardia sp. Cha107L01 TaxID=3457576 RepID=UPI00403EDAA2